MKIVTYQCELCKEVFKTPDAYRAMYQVYWKSDIMPQRYVLQPVTNSIECDKHICKSCILMIKELELPVEK